MLRIAPGTILLTAIVLSGCATTASNHRVAMPQETRDSPSGSAATRPTPVIENASPGERAESVPANTRLVAHQEESAVVTVAPVAAPPAEPMHHESAQAMPHGMDAESSVESEATYSAADFEAMALANNPTLLQAQAQIQAASGAAQQAGLYFNPVIGYSGEFDRVGAGRDESWNGGFVSQEFVMGDKLRLSRQKWSQRARIAETNYYAQQQRVLNDVRVQFYRTLAAQQLVDVHRELLANGEDNLQTRREMLNLGQTNQPGLLNAEVALQRDRLNLMQAENEFQHAWRTLTALAGSPELVPAKLAGMVATADESLDWDSALSQLLSSSPELQAAWQTIEHDRMTVEREEAEPIPNLLVDVSSIHTPVTNTTQTTLNIGIPLPVFDRNQGTVEQAQADLSQSHAESRRLELELRNRLATQFRDYETARQRVDHFETTMLPKAQQAYELLHESYKARRAAWPDVLMAQRQYLSLRAEQINNQLMYRESDVAVRGMLLTGGLTSPPPPVGAGHIDAIAKPR